MFEKYFSQTGYFFQPVNEIWALQAQAAESLSKTNGALMSDVWQGGLSFAQSLSAQKNFDDALKLQQTYWTELTQKVQHAAEENQSVMTEVSQKIAGVMNKTSPGDVAASVSPSASRAKAEKSAARAAEIVETAAKKRTETVAGKPTSARKNSGKSAASAKAEAGKISAKGADKADDKKTQTGSIGKAIGEAHKSNAAAAPASLATPKASAEAVTKSTAEKPAAGDSSASKAQQNKTDTKPDGGRVNH